MKISMWMIVEKLEKYQPEYSILDGTACITGVRFIFCEGSSEFQPQYVYLRIDKDTSDLHNHIESVVLTNGRDKIVLQGRDANEILNDLLAVFDFYNSWEKALWEASAHKSFQQIIDLGDSVLENPMMIADMDGNVLAMSSSFVDEDINDYWIESRVSGRIPTAVLGAPLRKQDGTLGSWSDQPEIYVMPGGTKTIGTYLRTNGELIAGFGLWEHKRPILPSDIELVKVLYDVLISTIDAQKRIPPTRSSASVIADLISGIQIEEDLLEKLELKCKHPWRLLVIDTPYRSDVVYKRNLFQRLQALPMSCIPLIYEDYVVVLVSQENADEIINSVLGRKDKQYYQAGLSLPFDDLRKVSTRYAQVLYAIKQSGGEPGVYYGEDYALPYLISLFSEQNKKQGLIHPALELLKQHDADKNSELYETLYQYLLCERSILLGSQALLIHKNTFMYRLQRIRTLTDLDLEDPMLRNYLLLSYLLDKA